MKYITAASLFCLSLAMSPTISAKDSDSPYREYTDAEMTHFRKVIARPGRYPSFLPDRPRHDANGYDHAWYDFPTQSDDAKNFKFKIKGYVFGFKMISGNYEGTVSDTDYAVRSTLKTSGLGALLKKLKIWGVTKGRYSTAKNMTTFYPDYHIQQNLDKKGRRVELNYNHNKKTVDVGINPPVGSQGSPLPTMQERYSANDAVTAILNIMMRDKETNLCQGDVNLFDSKQHYALRMNRVGTSRKNFLDGRVDTIKCHVRYVPISGFDPEDRPTEEEATTPVTFHMSYAPELDMYIPVRAKYKISAITANIRISDMWVNGKKISRD